MIGEVCINGLYSLVLKDETWNLPTRVSNRNCLGIAILNRNIENKITLKELMVVVQWSENVTRKLDRVALLVADPTDATTPLGKINPLRFTTLHCHNFWTKYGIFKLKKMWDVLTEVNKLSANQVSISNRLGMKALKKS